MGDYWGLIQLLAPVAVELGLRLVPSKNKLSLLRILSRALNILADAVDKVVPDKQK